MPTRHTDRDIEWDFTYRARTTPRIAMVVAALVVIAHVVAGILLRDGDTGVDFRLSDTFALPLIGVILGVAILTLTRPRIRAGARGVAVRNLGEEKVYDWSQVRGVYFPAKGHWARLELPYDEHVAVLAIASNDGDAAVEAMARFREIHERYAGQTA